MKAKVFKTVALKKRNEAWLKVAELKMLRFGHVQGRDCEHIGRRMLSLELLEFVSLFHSYL